MPRGADEADEPARLLSVVAVLANDADEDERDGGVDAESPKKSCGGDASCGREALSAWRVFCSGVLGGDCEGASEADLGDFPASALSLRCLASLRNNEPR
jgi:hypothetical protein